jgi:hypothetical protein
VRCALSRADRRAVGAVLLAGVVATGCAINPVTGDLEIVTVSTSEEITMGQRMAYSIQREMGLV